MSAANPIPESDLDPPKAVIYARVSSIRQVEEGHGLDSQATRCREYAKARGYEVIETFHERGISGGLMERPAFTALITYIRALKREGVIVIIDDISRFARDIESHWTLRRALTDIGGKLESPSITFGEDSDSVLIENLLASVSQHQREKNREQTKNRMRARALSGYWCFPAPPGYRYERVTGRGKLMVRNEPLASIIVEALEGFASGRFASQGDVKRFLKRQPEFVSRYPTGQMRYEEVIRLLSRPHYAGYIEVPAWGVSLREGQHEGLVSLATYTRIQERIREGARVPARSDINTDFPLRGFVACAECDRPLTACWSKSKTGTKHPYYMCFQKGCASYRKSIRRDEIEGAFGELLAGVTPSKAKISVARRIFAEIWDHRLARTKEQAAVYARKIAELDTQIGQLLDRLVATDSKTVISAYEARLAKLEQEKLVLGEKAAATGKPARPFEQMFELASRFLASPCKAWDSGRFELQRLVLKLTFAERLAYCRTGGFRTSELSLPFKALGDVSTLKNDMAETMSVKPILRCISTY